MQLEDQTRDMFAHAALKELVRDELKASRAASRKIETETIAIAAYMFADAMMIERAKRLREEP